MLRLILIIAVLGSAAAYLTKPSPQDVEDQISALLQTAIANGSLDDVRDPAAAVLMLACKSDPAACARMAREAMDVTYEDRTLYARVDAVGFGRQIACYAAYTKLFCPGGVADAN